MAFSTHAAFEFLHRAHQSGRLAHAYLITGDPGSGKRALALQLARLVQGLPVSGEEGSIPDVVVVEPESKSRTISVDQTRELERSLQMRSSQGKLKVGILFDADRMNIPAANSFLKTLEEPPKNSLLILVTAHPEMLLDTILSRCILIQLFAPKERQLTAQQEQLLGLVADYFRGEPAGLSPVFSLVRGFTQLLLDAKAEMQKESDEAFKQEEALYKQSTDGKWLEEREQHFKALTESRYLQQRSLIIGTLLQWWGDVLRQQNGGAGLDFPAYAQDTTTLAQRFSTPEVLRRLDAIEGLRENFTRNVQEQLAIEVAFLNAFKL